MLLWSLGGQLLGTKLLRQMYSLYIEQLLLIEAQILIGAKFRLKGLHIPA